MVMRREVIKSPWRQMYPRTGEEQGTFSMHLHQKCLQSCKLACDTFPLIHTQVRMIFQAHHI